MTATTIEKGMQENPNVSLRQLAITLGVNYQVVLREAKKPIAGVAYNPDSVNYEAIANLFTRKEIATIDWEAIASQSTPRTAIVTREWVAGDELTFRNFVGEYTILLATEDHYVFMETGSTKPRVMNKATFEHQGPRVK